MYAVQAAGIEILKLIPPALSANACAHMAASWAAMIRDHTDIPIHVVAGNLTTSGKRIYYSEEPPEVLHDAFTNSSLAYNGHVWVVVPGAVGDIALFRSAYAQPQGHWFRTMITAQFGPKAGMMLADPPADMAYEARFVLTNAEITSLIKAIGAMRAPGDRNLEPHL